MLRVRSLCPARIRRLIAGGLFAAALAFSAEAPRPAPDEAKPELRGVLTLAKRSLFCIHHPARNHNVWVAPGQPSEGIVVLAHDSRNNTVTIEYRERTYVLALPAGKVRAGESETPPASDDGTNLNPPSSIRDAIRNRALTAEEIKPWADTAWYRDFIKQHPEAAPPVIK